MNVKLISSLTVCLSGLFFCLSSPIVLAADNVAKLVAVKNQYKSNLFLKRNMYTEGVIVTHSGLQYKVIHPGSGVKPSSHDRVAVDYEGKLSNGRVFDSSYQYGHAVSFPVADVIPGWQEALQLMKEGATWMLYIPPELAYGKQGIPGVICANEVLLFKVHLQRVQKDIS